MLPSIGYGWKRGGMHVSAAASRRFAQMHSALARRLGGEAARGPGARHRHWPE
jgi:hypothetical protein